jgi:hypothetical protein
MFTKWAKTSLKLKVLRNHLAVGENKNQEATT